MKIPSLSLIAAGLLLFHAPFPRAESLPQNASTQAFESMSAEQRGDLLMIHQQYLAAIEAYRQAFAPGDGAQLIVKSINGVHRVEAREQVERAGDSGIAIDARRQLDLARDGVRDRIAAQRRGGEQAEQPRRQIGKVMRVAGAVVISDDLAVPFAPLHEGADPLRDDAGKARRSAVRAEIMERLRLLDAG